MSNPNNATATTTDANATDAGGAGGLAVGLSIGGVLLAAAIVLTVAYCFFSRRKIPRGSDHADNNNVQRMSMNSEGFSHVTNLSKLEPLDIRTSGKAIPKRTKLTLDQKQEAGKTDDLSDVDLSLFSDEGQINPAFLDDEGTMPKSNSMVKKDNNANQENRENEENVVLFKLEGVVKLGVSQIVGFEKNIGLSVEDPNGEKLKRTLTTNGNNEKQVTAKGNGTTPNHVSIDCVDTVHNTHDNEKLVCSKTNTVVSRKISDKTDTKHDLANSSVTVGNIVNKGNDEVVKKDQTGPSNSQKTFIIDECSDSVSPSTSIQQFVAAASLGKSDIIKTTQQKPDISELKSASETENKINTSTIEKCTDVEDDSTKLELEIGSCPEVTTIIIDKNDPRTSFKSGRHERHDKIVFKSESKPENRFSVKGRNKRSHDAGVSFKDRETNLSMQFNSGIHGDRKKLKHVDKIQHNGVTFTSAQPEHKGKQTASKSVLTREGSVYDIPWDMTDVGALLMQLNDIKESDSNEIERVS